MVHKMKLRKNPFESIKSGTKNVEMRLFDEKRRLIAIGDNIEFCNIDTNEKILAEVLQLKRFNRFEELYNFYGKVQIGYAKDEIANAKDMLDYYSEEDIKKYGVLAIEIKIL